MSLWNRLTDELRSAGKAAAGAIDEGKVRLELFRVRQLADKAAQALGYALQKAGGQSTNIEPALLERLRSSLSAHETEAKRLEGVLDRHRAGGPAAPEA